MVRDPRLNCGLKHLRMTMHYEAYSWKKPIGVSNDCYHYLVKDINCFLRTLLQYCSALESFDLQGDINSALANDGDYLDLSFIGNLNIKEVSLSIKPCRYYSLNGGEKYVCYNGEERVKYDPTSATFGGVFPTEEYDSRLILCQFVLHSSSSFSFI